MAFQVLAPDEAEILVALVSAIVPHRQEALQATKVDTALALDTKMVADLGLRALCREGLRSLELRAQQEHHFRFAALGADEQAALLATIEPGAFFQTLVHLTKYDFYNRHIVWEAIGYPDLGNESGYLRLGFDRLDA
jgi:hypothetical protein